MSRAEKSNDVSALNSAIYEGWVRHRRYAPKHHEFSYKVFMVYLDLQELDQVFSQTALWSMQGFSLSWFRRQDFFDGNTDKPLYDTVADKVFQDLQFRPEGSIRMLANLRYFGYIINPIVCYYCFDKNDNLQAVVTEVTNTPWGERCHYVLDLRQGAVSSSVFNKEMHVSPFQPMNLSYQWRGKKPTKNLLVHLDVFSQSEKSDSPVFDATLAMKRHAMTASAMRRAIIKYPWMTVKVFAAIYWQALKLWMRGFSFFSHPGFDHSERNNQYKEQHTIDQSEAVLESLVGDKNESSQYR